MSVFSDTMNVLLHEGSTWIPQLLRHVLMSLVALSISIAVGLPIGAWLTRREQWAFAVTSIANLGRTVPSLALLALVYPFVGTGILPAIIALVALGVPPILLSTYTGIREIDQDISDAAAGMGLTSMQRLAQAELPVAAPVVLSGIRTSAVQIVASATLAALIGGGGLGELIMAGLANLRYDLLLTGAILVAIVAAATEVAFSLLEKRGLPAGIRLLQSTPVSQALDYSAGSAVTHRRWRMVVVGGAVACATMVGAGSMASGMIAGIGVPNLGAGGPLPKVVVGSKNFTESVVVAELYAQALEAQGHPVERRLNLGTTAVADAALTHGDIDMYPEYTGTSLVAVLGKDVPAVGGGGSDGTSAMALLNTKVEQTVRSGYRKRGTQVLASSPFSNGNAIAVTQATADRYGLETMSDLAKVSRRLKFGSIPGFDTRADGLGMLKKTYGLQFKQVQTLENGIKYKALMDGKVDAVYGFETEGQIARNKLVVLRDDRAVWPPYHSAPIVSGKFAKRSGPAFAPTIDAVTRLLDADTMRALNDAVDSDKQDPADVARTFLSKHGLDKRGPRPKVRIASKDFTEQYVLGEIYAQALEARGFPVERRMGLGATAVADGALKRGQIDMYPEYTGTMWTAVLKRKIEPGTSAATISTGLVKPYAKRGMRVLDETPFSNGYAISVRRETAKQYDLKTLSDLAKVAPKLKLGTNPSFKSREDGVPLLKKVYGIDFGSIQTLENGIKYKSLKSGTVQVIDGYETDGQLAASDFIVLKDDKAAWPPYQAVPVVSSAFMKQAGPDFAATINHVSSLLDTKTMARLNAEVDLKKHDPSDVAKRFLAANGLVS
jgi:osmoprotectant transport system permease protein